MKISHKIYLQGDMALRFGESFTFYGDSVQDAVRCIHANRPDFKEYLIECHEKGYHFLIDTQDSDIDSPEEYFLPVLKGDIIISAIPAGSGSGMGKILAAAAMFALLFIPIGGASLFSTAQGMTGIAGGFAQAGVYLGASIATNLAITGLSELMAPDPSVDQQDEGYLFNGSERNIAEGLPIPLLYGELRVPGYPVSFELLQSDKVIEQAQTSVSQEGHLNTFTTISPYSNNSTTGDEDTEGDQSAVDLANYESAKAEDTARLSRDQTALFTDIISEGPIYGLVDGGSSVFLDGDSMQTNEQSTIRLSETGVTFTFTNGSSSVTINKNNYTKDIVLDENGTKYLIVRSFDSSASASAVEWTGIGSSRGVKITTSSAFWEDAYIYDNTNFKSVATVRLVDSNSQTVFEGYLDSKDSTTVGYCKSLVGSDINPLYADGTYTVVIDGKLEISSIASDQSTLTLASNFAGPDGDYQCDLGSGTYSSHSLIDNINLYSKKPNTVLQFRTGTLGQDSFLDSAGTGINNTAIGPGASFSATTISKFSDGSGSPTAEFEGTSATGFGLTSAQAEEVDEARVFFTYPQIWNRELAAGATNIEATVLYTVQINIKRGGVYQGYINLPDIRHYKKSNAPLTIQETFDLKQYAPFEDFKIKFVRSTNEDIAYDSWSTTGDLSEGEGYSTASSVSVTSLSSIIKENLRYPLTAMAKVQARASDFNNKLPQRTYHCKGLKVLVPSNYVTRDENDGKEAKYTRNVSTGAITSSYQDWDGNFRAQKVYTNNPAWIFYDILTNNRYGLGNWIGSTEIDKFALYRIARYCDEMVNDGNGSTEPRYTTNTYLTQATDAFKVIKDLATVFNGMLYWLDSEVYPVIDQAANSVYNFSKANVIDGAFSYQSSGSKTKFNQVVVKWNNPDNDYKLSNLVLEDRDNIVKTGKIISKDVVAFGCTSEGQAIRYGRWKLWTAINQTEVVSFKTSINAAFLIPGDIINIQDADRYPGHALYSGRVSNTGTRNTTTLPLDREIELVSGSTYKLSVLIEEPATFLAQESATINGVSYEDGDLILTDAGGSAITTESTASNLVDDSGNPVLTNWKPYTRAEEQTVSTSSGTGITSLTVSTAFSATPNAETVWVLKEIVSEVATLDSKKEYKILSISQEDSSLYGITAVEHYNEKFTAVESDLFSLQVQDPVFPTPKTTDIVPAPTNVYAYVSDLGPGQLIDDVELFWDAPTQSGNATSLYPYVDGYEIEHNVASEKSPFVVGKDTRYLRGMDIPPGTYTIGVRTISQGKRSAVTKTTFTVQDPAKQAVPRGFGMALGATISSPAFITAAGVFTIENQEYAISPAGDPQFVRELDGSPGTEYTQDCSNIASVNFSGLSTEFDKQVSSHYIMFDADAADPLKLIKFYQDDDLGYGYFYDAGTGNTTHTGNWTALTGTVSVAANSNRVVGSSTSFSSELSVGDIIKFSSTQAAKVAYVASDTDVRIDKSFTTAISAGTTAYENTFKFDKDQDAVIAQIRNDSGTFKYFPVNLNLNPDLAQTIRFVKMSAEPGVLLFNADDSKNWTENSTLTLTVVTTGFSNPEFQVTGAGFSFVDESADTAFSTSNTRTLTLDDTVTYTSTFPVFTVTVREKNDPSNTAKQKTDTISLSLLKDGVAGSAGNVGLEVYKATTTNSAPSVPSGDLTYTFATGALTEDVAGNLNGWTVAVPSISTSTPYIWVTKAVALGAVGETTDTIETGDWASPALYSEGPLNSAIVELFQVTSSSSAPADPTTSLTYTFSTAALSGSGFNGWSQTASDTATGEYLWKIAAYALSNTTTDSITTDDWADAKIVGYSGTNGDDGAPGAPGATGDDGLRTIQGYLYYESTGGAPSAPTGNTYTFSTGLVTGTGINDSGTTNVWKNSPNTQDPTSTNTHYTVRYYGTESSSGSSTISVSYSGVVQYTNFTGVVTFSGGTFQEGGTDITTIDGGNIDTGTISLQALNSSTSFSESNHTFALATTGLSIGGTSYDTTAKFTSSHAGDCTALFCQYTGSDTDSFGLASVTDAGQAAGFSYGNSGTYGFGGTNYLTVCSASYLFQGFGGSSTETFSVANDGTIKVGNSTFVDDSRNITCGTIDATGAITATGDITAFYSSDRRMKDNVTPIENSLEKVSQLGGYEFDWNHVSPYEGMHDIGVIAQEVLKVAPEAVAKRENDMLAVRYEKLVPLLIEAIKDLKKEVEELKRGSSK